MLRSKISEIEEQLENQDYKKALILLDGLDIRKCKLGKDLVLFAQVYEQNGYPEEAEELLMKAYLKYHSTRALIGLVHLYTKQGEYSKAELYLKEYIDMDRDDAEGLILRYRLDKAQKKPLEILIEDLVQIKHKEYREEYAYALAKLYHRAGQKDRCLETCNEILLWFGEGEIVERAKLLKEYYLGNNEEILQMKEMILEKIDILVKDKPEHEPLVTKQDLERVQSEFGLENTKNLPTEDEDNQESLLREEEVQEEPAGEAETEPTGKEPTGEAETEPTEKEPAQPDSEMQKEPWLVKGTDLADFFGCYLDVRGVKEQLNDFFTHSETASGEYNVIISGSKGSAKTLFSKKLLTTFFRLGYIKTAQIAKMSADKLNSMSFLEKAGQLRGKSLIIEHAGRISDKLAMELTTFITAHPKEVVFVLIDETEGLDTLLSAYPKLSECFPNRIEIPELNQEELMRFALEFIQENEYMLDKGAYGALELIIGQIAESTSSEERLLTVMKVIENAKRCVEYRNMNVLSRVVEMNSYKLAHFMTITEADLAEAMGIE